MTSSYSKKIAKLKNALENVFVKKTDIKDNLTSTDTNKPLSANQGKILDTNKVDKISGKSLSTNDFTNTYKTKLDNLDTLLENKANNTHTHGNLQNDGSIGISNNINKNVVTDGNGKITTEDKPTIPSASSTVPSADTSSGSYGSGTTYARANHQHPKSSLYAETSHTHTKSEITNFTHTHSISDVTTLQTVLDGKANNTHNHSISNITNLQSTLNNKANEEHTHPHEDISFTGSRESWQGLGSDTNVGQALDYLMSLVELNSSALKQDKAKLDNLSYDSGWQEVTFKSGYAKYRDSTSVYIRRKGDLVELSGVWKPTSKKSAASNPVPFASIPDELKPTKAINVICPGIGKNTYRLTVDTDANLKWSQYGTNTSIGLETNHFGHVHCMWTI